MVLSRDNLEHRLGQLDVAVLEFAVGIPRGRGGSAQGKTTTQWGCIIPRRVVNRVNKLVKSVALIICEGSGSRIAATGVDAHLVWVHGVGPARRGDCVTRRKSMAAQLFGGFNVFDHTVPVQPGARRGLGLRVGWRV